MSCQRSPSEAITPPIPSNRPPSRRQQLSWQHQIGLGATEWPIQNAREPQMHRIMTPKGIRQRQRDLYRATVPWRQRSFVEGCALTSQPDLTAQKTTYHSKNESDHQTLTSPYGLIKLHEFLSSRGEFSNTVRKDTASSVESEPEQPN